MGEEKVVYANDKQVSELLGIARQTLANWRSQQRGPRYTKAGRLVRYSMRDLLAFMEVRQIGTQDQPKDQE